MRSTFRHLVGFAVAVLSGGFAQSQAQTPTTSTEEWSFRAAPYVWATALNGDIGVDGVTSHVNATVGEVIDHVDGGLMFTAEARWRRFGLVTDFIYADLADRKSYDTGLLEKVKIKVNQYIWSQALAYRAVENDTVWLDVLSGFRLMSIDQTLSVTARDPFSSRGEISESASLDRTWVDPIVGLRSAVKVYDGWAVRSEADVGGFDANSKFTWQAFAALGYDATDSTRILVGYRGLGYSHDRDGFKYDTVMHGPMVGVGVGF